MRIARGWERGDWTRPVEAPRGAAGIPGARPTRFEDSGDSSLCEVRQTDRAPVRAFPADVRSGRGQTSNAGHRELCQGVGQVGRILIIGGTRFMGYHLVWRLLAAGHQVTILNRGRRSDPFGARVERLQADRTSPAFTALLERRAFDAVVDFAAFNGDDARGVLAALGDRVGHYVFISSGAVYMSREGASIPCPGPLAEAAYAGATAPPPASAADIAHWRYGAGKRAAEDALMQAWDDRRFPVTCVRLPVVNGELDPGRRLESYLWRILDGGPVLLPDAGATRIRQVYCGDVVKALASLLGRADTFGRAYNLSQEEEPTVREVVALLASLVGAPDRSQAVDAVTLSKAGLSETAISPFSGRWSSRLDASRAKAELGFRPEPLVRYLDKIVVSVLSHPLPEPPEDYAHRALEVELGRRAASV